MPDARAAEAALLPSTTAPPSGLRPVAPRLATTLAFAAHGFGYGSWVSNIPAIKAALGLSDGALGLALLAVAVGAIAAMPLSGRLSGRIGSHRLTVLSGWMMALALALIPQAGTPLLFALSLMLLGATAGVMDVSMNTHATLVERGWGAAIMSSFHAAFSLGGLAGAAMAGLLLGAGWPATANLLLAGGLLALAVLGAAPFLGGRIGEAPGEGGHGFALPSRAVLGLGAIAVLALVAEGAVGDWSALYLAAEAGASAGAATAGFAGFSLTMTAGRLGGDLLVRRWGGVRVLRWGAALAAAGFALLIAAPVVPAAVAGFALVGLGLANVFPVLFSAAGRLGGISPGMGVAMVATLGYGGLLGGPPVLGFVAQLSGLRAAMMVLLLAALAIVASAGVLRRGH